MRKGIKLDDNNQRLTIQKIYNDDSMGEKFHVWFVDNFFKLEVNAPAWKFFSNCTELIDIMKDDVIGVDLSMLKEDLINRGYIELK